MIVVSRSHRKVQADIRLIPPSIVRYPTLRSAWRVALASEGDTYSFHLDRVVPNSREGRSKNDDA